MNAGSEIHVTCLQNVERVAEHSTFDVVYSFIDPGTKIKDLGSERTMHRVYYFFDQERGKFADAIENVLESLVASLAVHIERGDRILLHCHAGVSRSPAACYLAYALISSNPSRAFEAMLSVCVKPWPNLKIIEMASALPSFGQGLVAPLLDYRSRHTNRLRAYGRLNAARGLVSPINRID